MGSIEGIVKNLLLVQESSGSVSISDFLDRVIHSKNISLSQFAKSTISRVISDQIGIVNIRTCRLLLDELLIKFPNDSQLRNLTSLIASEEIRRNSSKPPLFEKRRTISTPSFADRSDLVSRLKSSKRDASSRGFTRPISRVMLDLTSSSSSSEESSVLAKTPIFKRRLVLDSTSSSSDEGTSIALSGLHLRKLREYRKKRYFAIWKRNSHALASTKTGFQIIASLWYRKKCLLFFHSFKVKAKKFRDFQTDENCILVSLGQEIKLKERFYDSWRSVFVQRMEARRAQVSGILRLFRFLNQKRMHVLRDSMAQLSLSSRISLGEEGAKRIRKLVKKKIFGKFAEFKKNISVSKISRELKQVKLKAGVALIEKKLSGRILIDYKAFFSRLKLVQLNRNLTRKTKKSVIAAWTKSLISLDNRRKAFNKIQKFNRRCSLRNAFAKLKQCGNIARDERESGKGIARIVDRFVSKQVKSAFDCMKQFGRKKVILERLFFILRRKIVLWGIRKLQNHSTGEKVKQINNVLGFGFLENRNSKLNAFRMLREHSSNCRLVQMARDSEKKSDKICELETELSSVKAGIAHFNTVRSSLSTELENANLEKSKVSLYIESESRKRRIWNEWIRCVEKRKIIFRIKNLCQNIQRKNFQFYISQLRRKNAEIYKTQYRVIKFCNILQSVIRRRILSPTVQHIERSLIRIEKVPIEYLSRRISRKKLEDGFQQWTWQIHKKSILKKIMRIISVKITRHAFYSLKDFSYKAELIEALDECDQWRIVSEEKKIFLTNFLERNSVKMNSINAKFAFFEWLRVARERKQKLSRIFTLISKVMNRNFFYELKILVSSEKVSHLLIAGFTKISLIVEARNVKLLALSLIKFNSCRHERTVALLERVSRSELNQHEAVMREMERAAHELEADYTTLASRSKKISDRNETLENQIVVSSSKLEHEVKENEVLLLKLNDLKNTDMQRRIEIDQLVAEKRDFIDKARYTESLKVTIESQKEEIELLKSKLNEYVKLSTSIQFYKNKVSLQSEQIASLQSKLRESSTTTQEDVLFSSPIHSKSEDVTYASSSLRGLQQAVDRSNLLRSTRRSNMDLSQISGDSTRRRGASFSRSIR